MGLFGGTRVKTNMAEFSAEYHSVDCSGGKKVITTRGIRIWSPIQVRTPPNRAQLCLANETWCCTPCGRVTLNAVCLISKMRKGNKERKNSLILAGEIKSEKKMTTNLLLTEREGRTGESWPEVVAVRTERSEVRTKTTEGQYSPVRLELARLVSSLLYGTRTMLVLSLPAFENKKYTAYDRFHGHGPYGEIPTEKEPIRTLGFTLPYNNTTYLGDRTRSRGEGYFNSL